MSLTISTTINGTLSLVPSNNPVTISARRRRGDGDRRRRHRWRFEHGMDDFKRRNDFLGVRLGLYLNGPSSNLSNSGSISGAGGMFLNNGGSVTNTANGTITATGKMPSSLATISGIYVTGPSGAAISVTNAGVITAADGYGIGLGASGSVNNSGKVTGGEDGVLFDAGVGNLQNSGSITATLDDGVGMFQGGTVTNAVGASISGVAGVDGGGDFHHRRRRDDNKQRAGQWLPLRHSGRGRRLGNQFFNRDDQRPGVRRLLEQRRYALQQRRDFLHRGWQRRG